MAFPPSKVFSLNSELFVLLENIWRRRVSYFFYPFLWIFIWTTKLSLVPSYDNSIPWAHLFRRKHWVFWYLRNSREWTEVLRETIFQNQWYDYCFVSKISSCYLFNTCLSIAKLTCILTMIYTCLKPKGSIHGPYGLS